jgi:hypothetical protein
MGKTSRIFGGCFAVFLTLCNVAETILIHEPTSLLCGVGVRVDIVAVTGP